MSGSDYDPTDHGLPAVPTQSGSRILPAAEVVETRMVKLSCPICQAMGYGVQIVSVVEIWPDGGGKEVSRWPCQHWQEARDALRQKMGLADREPIPEVNDPRWALVRPTGRSGYPATVAQAVRQLVGEIVGAQETPAAPEPVPAQDEAPEFNEPEV